jgi:hypothetical protein
VLQRSFKELGGHRSEWRRGFISGSGNSDDGVVGSRKAERGGSFIGMAELGRRFSRHCATTGAQYGWRGGWQRVAAKIQWRLAHATSGACGHAAWTSLQALARVTHSLRMVATARASNQWSFHYLGVHTREYGGQG